MKTDKEINWFDTPEDRRKGRGGMANFMAQVLRDRAEKLKTNQQNNDSNNRKDK